MANKTPLYDYYVSKKLKLVEFGGWLLPVQHDSIFNEHNTVREKAGLFDVSHMGQIFITGSQAVPQLNRLISNDLTQAADSRAQYNLIMTPSGGVIDDTIVFKFSDEKLMVVTNAANTDAVLEHFNKEIQGAEVRHVPDIFKIDIQGPESPRIARKVFGDMPVNLKYFQFGTVCHKGEEVIISRSGYTGEHGYEMWGPGKMAEDFWKEILAAGQGEVAECGLGSRDTLRLEAGLPLYGHEISADVNPFEAGLGRFVSLEQGDFIGRDVLVRVNENGPERELVNLVMQGKAAAREGYDVLNENGDKVGTITSGAPSPTVGKPIAMARVKAGSIAVGDNLLVQVRKRQLPAEVVKSFIKKRAAKKIVIED